MDTELDQLLLMMLTIALHKAQRVPTPDEPADAAWEKATDEFCLRFARTHQAEPPSPEVASALIPRLRIAKVFARPVQSQFAMQARLGDSSVNEREILEFLLVTLWHDQWKDQWIAGEIG